MAGLLPRLRKRDAANPCPVVFCDPDGNGDAIKPPSVLPVILHSLPVLLCDPTGQAVVQPIVFTSNGNSITITGTLTGIKLGARTPVVIANSSGNALGLSGFTYGAQVCSPVAVVPCDAYRNALSLALST